MREALRYNVAPGFDFDGALRLAAEFHDLGKLEPENQAVLRSQERGKLPINHVDAGVAHLIALGVSEAALAVYAHHVGLCDLPSEIAKQQRSKYDPTAAVCRDYNLKLQTDARLPGLIAAHRETVGIARNEVAHAKRQLSGFERRLLLSCLVDADHTDTAIHYGEQPQAKSTDARWAERLAALDVYVEGLSVKSGPRDTQRRRIYNACRGSATHHPVLACDSPVGSGKTTAIMAYLLQCAIALKLRRIFVVLPYTNIVNQAVNVYKTALTLPGEEPDRVVGAHHHLAEFSNPELRYLTTLWDSPIIVTTAVQFFETLGSNSTIRLRKLHQLPGAAVFVDEAHAAMPIHLWPYMWDQLMMLANQWSCRFVLGSGSLAKFWENPRIMVDREAVAIPSMIPADLQRASSVFEQARVTYRSRPEPLSLSELCDWICSTAGTRLVLMNTVQSAAMVARELRERNVLVLHLSTALSPKDRKIILRLVRCRLKTKPNLNWVLVATSCVEAGVDLSFQVAFRERCRASSLVQIGGRVNRHAEREVGTVWDFIVSDPLLSSHPDFSHTRDVVADIFRKDMWGTDLTTLMTFALQEEFKRQSGETKIRELRDGERVGAYPKVAELTRLITADTRLVVVDAELIAQIEQGLQVPRHDLLSKSVQIWSSRIAKLALRRVGDSADLYAWDYPYDKKFLGIMEGILALEKVNRDTYALV